MTTLLQDVRYGARMFVKNPGFTLIAVLTLALGIGANTAIFSVVNGVLLKPLPYPEPAALVVIYGNFLAMNMLNTVASVPEFVDYKQQTQSFESLGAYQPFSANLAPNDGGEPERVEGGLLTPEMFSVLKAAPYKGRVFLPEEAQDGRDDVVVLGYGLWQRRFAGDTNLIGRRILINGRSVMVIGVMPPGFAFPQRAELWRPLWFPKEQYDQQRRGARGLWVVARLKPDVSLTEAQAEMDRLSGQLTQQYPRNYSERRWRISLTPMLADSIGDVRRPLLVLLGAVAFVMLIACANVANLLLARAVARRGELAVRLALGAQSWRIVRQLLTESLLLAVAGGVVGLLLGVWGVDLLLRVLPDNLPRFGEVAVDARVLLMTCAVTLLTGVIFGIAPALAGARADIHETLKEGGRSGSAGTNRQRLRNAFVIGEIGLALVLLIGAGLTLKSFWRLQNVDPGFNADGLLTMRLLLPNETHPQPAQRAAFYQQALERVKTLPNVESVSAATRLPMTRDGFSGTISGENSAVGPNDAPVEAEWTWATPDHFKTLGIPLLNGRSFIEADADSAPLVAIVDETFARRFYPNEDPIGKRIKRGRLDSQRPWWTIVGVVRHVRNQRLDITSRVQVYFPFYQEPPSNMSLAVRARAGDPLALSNTVRAAIQSVDRNQPVYSVKTMGQIVAESVSPRRLALLLLGIFAAVALLLAAAGIYGVVSYAVAQRTHEIGIRMALGAQASDVLKLVFGQGLKLAASGVAIGLAGALALTRLMQDLLFGVQATDPLTFAAIALLLTVVALVACWVPARRATKVDPMIALRME